MARTLALRVALDVTPARRIHPAAMTDPGRWLGRDELLSVVTLAPLVSIDLVVTSPSGEVLVGKRVNRPARDTWFVPGGRILKGERLRDAFARIALAELGREVPYASARWMGAWDHVYDDNFADVEGVGTQYIVLAHGLVLDLDLASLPPAQHRGYLWMPVADVLSRPDVHPNSRAYFDGSAPSAG